MLGASCTWVGRFHDGMKWLSATLYDTSGTHWGWCQGTEPSALRLTRCALCGQTQNMEGEIRGEGHNNVRAHSASGTAAAT